MTLNELYEQRNILYLESQVVEYKIKCFENKLKYEVKEDEF